MNRNAFCASFVLILAVLMLWCSAAVAVTFSYDSLHRLTRVEYDNGTSIAYTYDAAGNRLTLMAQPNNPALLAIKPTSTNVSASASARSIAVSASVAWSAVDNSSWIWITSGSSGTFDGSVGYSLSNNPSTSARTGTIVVAGGGLARTFTVVQAGVAEGLSWTLGGDANWHLQTATTHDGVDAQQSGAILDDQQSWMETTVTGPGTISFWWKVSSEWVWDPLRFQIGDSEQERIAGEINWQQRSFSVPAGSQTLRWTYIKDSSVNAGADAGWVDQVVWVPGAGMAPSGGQTVTERRQPFTWPAVAGASWYQLYISRNGQAFLTHWVDGSTAWLPSASGLPGGSYQWWVQPWGSGIGLGPWSPAASFSIPVTTPGALTQIAPQGTQAGYNLTYRWQKDANATWYRLWVGRTGAGTWHDRWFELSGTGEAAENPGGAYPGPAKPVQTAPSGTIANNLPTFQWSGGNCTWWLNSWGPDGYGPWAGPKAFSIPHAADSWYRVYVNRGSTMALDRWTQGSNLPSPVALSSGSYSWWLGVWDAAGNQTIWSDRTDFTVPP